MKLDKTALKTLNFVFFGISSFTGGAAIGATTNVIGNVAKELGSPISGAMIKLGGYFLSAAWGMWNAIQCVEVGNGIDAYYSKKDETEDPTIYSDDPVET